MVGKLSDHLSLGFFSEAHKCVGVAKIPDGHVANFKLASGLAFAVSNGLDLNGRDGHFSSLVVGGPRLPMSIY